ncbi:MAG: Ig-like domain-containing protein [Candidatus Marinimicrobia bacterium]|nr:Ig-like domain-containing protein [Candidatus Neomarinimicrobiota bacterium]
MNILTKLKVLFSSMIILSVAFSQAGLKIKADNAQVQEDGSVKINVLKNDDLKDKSNVAIEIVTEPEKGKVQVQGEKILYTPEPDVSGVDKFDYKVDNGLETGTAQVRVNINPVNDAPTGLSLSESQVKENAAAGTVIGRLKVEDPDPDDKFKFGLAKDNRDDFSLDGSNLLTKRPFDFEEERSFTIAVQVSDSGDEKIVENVTVTVKDQNEAPVLVSAKETSFSHSENLGKIVGRLKVEDPDENQSSVKFKLTKSDDKEHFKITRAGDLAFLRDPDYEGPVDRNKDNVYQISYKAIDSKDDKLHVSGSVNVKVKDAEETEVIALDKRKYVAWAVDHQPYHIIMEDAIQNYMALKYINAGDGDAIEDGEDTSIREMSPTDQIIIVQEKGNSDEIHEIWYGNGLDFSIIDREKVDWVFSQDIQKVLIAKDEYLTSESETVFHKSESERLMAGYGSIFSVWHANNFKMSSLFSFSIRSNLIQYAANMRVGNSLIGLPGLLAGSSELGIATQRSEFGFRVPFAFDFGSGNYDGFDVASSDYLGLYARGNIDNLFGTRTSLHGLIGFTFYPPSSGDKLFSPSDISNVSTTDTAYWNTVKDETENINILDSYALAATTVEVPVKLPSVGRITAAPGFHYLKIAHRLKDTRQVAIDNNQELYERTFYNQVLTPGDTVSWSQEDLNGEGDSFTRLSSFYIRFDVTGKIGEKPKFIERLSFMDFIQVSKVPFYELSLQFISGLNMITKLNLNITDDIGLSLSNLSKNSDLKGNWMPDSKFWFGLNYRANF